MKHRVLAAILTLFGAGLSIKAPGTVGSLFALGLWYACGLNKVGIVLQLFAALFMAVLGYLTCLLYEKESQEKNKDSQHIVIDEAAGLWLALIAIPDQQWWVALLIFILFRVFDIIKIFPCNSIDQRMKNAAGIMLDDLIAGIYANTTVYVLLSMFKWL
ncbi:phosphatidylglycerophosphatase A [bacterium]|nr:phosphatidylglycerophosphatase A [bacterium]